MLTYDLHLLVLYGRVCRFIKFLFKCACSPETYSCWSCKSAVAALLEV